MSTRSGRSRQSAIDLSPVKARKGISPSRSPGRNRKSSPPAKSPSRKSPSRKSPSRKPESKFPARKSPSRATKKETVPEKFSPSKRASIKSVEVKLQEVSKFDLYRAPRSRRSDYSIKDVTSGLDSLGSGDKVNGIENALSKDKTVRNRKLAEDIVPRRSNRIKDVRDSISDKGSSLSASKSVSQSIDLSYSDDEEDFKQSKSKSLSRRLATPLQDGVAKLTKLSSRWEFGGRIGCLFFIVLLPLTIFGILVACQSNCQWKSAIDFSALQNASKWFSPLALSIITAQYLIQAFIACVPVCGVKADKGDGSGDSYNFNGFFAAVMTTAFLFGLDYFKVLNSNGILNDYLKLAALSYVIAVALSILLYFNSRKLNDSELNPYGNSGYAVYDFWIGREIHPHIKKLNLKILVSRVCNINAIILTLLIFKHGIHVPSNITEKLSVENYKEVLPTVQYKPTILLFSMFQLIYILNFVVKEYKVTSTFFWQSEGLGYLQTVTSALYPFYFTTISKFILDSGLSLTTNTLIASSLLYTLGLVIMLISNNVKYEFRKNPLNPSFSNLETMPTFHGKKLLVSGLWGLVRHPNYTGDILIHLSLALPGFLTGNWVVASPALLTILSLAHRAWRDHARCRKRYGAAWQRYCKKVPSALIPKVL